jgi:hypothetical protein
MIKAYILKSFVCWGEVGLVWGHMPANTTPHPHTSTYQFVGLAYLGKDIVFRFIIEYSSFRDFGL